MSEQDNLTRIRAVRAGNRGVVTKLIKEAECLIEEQNETNLGRMQTICTILNDKMGLLKELDEKILNACELEEIEDEVEEADMIMSRIMDIKRIILNNNNPTVVKPKTNATQEISPQAQQLHQVGENATLDSAIEGSTGTSHLTNNNVESSSQQDVINSGLTTTSSTSVGVPFNIQSAVSPTSSQFSKLPKLVLPHFNGDITNFRSFWDSFTNAVHNNPRLTTIEKFNYLRSYLEGRALRSIQGLTLTEGNYQSAIEILKQRFGKPQAIISAHMEELMKIPACSDKVSQMRFLYDKISINVRGLESLGVTSQQYGSLLIPVIMAKIPTDVRVQIARKTTKDVWDINELLDAILHEVEAREISENVKIWSDNRKPSPGQSIKTPAAAALTTQDAHPKPIQCVYCKDYHFSASCNSIVDATQRKAFLKKENRCFICLGKNHGEGLHSPVSWLQYVCEASTPATFASKKGSVSFRRI